MRFVRVPTSSLSPAALHALVEEFVTRDGTDYGASEQPLEAKRSAVLTSLQRGEVEVVFDPETESCNIVLARDLSSLGAASKPRG